MGCSGRLCAMYGLFVPHFSYSVIQLFIDWLGTKINMIFDKCKENKKMKTDYVNFYPSVCNSKISCIFVSNLFNRIITTK